MSGQGSNEDSAGKPTEWLIVPPTGVAGCPLEDWLAALNESGEKPQARRMLEGLWIHFESNPVVGFVSIDRGLVEAISFEIPADAPATHLDHLRQAITSLGWEIWEQNPDDDGDDDWDADFEQDEI